jgi:hypothetical protein
MPESTCSLTSMPPCAATAPHRRSEYLQESNARGATWGCIGVAKQPAAHLARRKPSMSATQHPAELRLPHIYAAARLGTMGLASADAVQCSGSGERRSHEIWPSAAAHLKACASSTTDQTCMGPADWNTGVLYFVLMLLQSGTGRPAMSKDRPTAPLGSGYAPSTFSVTQWSCNRIALVTIAFCVCSRPSTRQACVVTVAGSRRGVQLPKFGCTLHPSHQHDKPASSAACCCSPAC